MHCPGTCCSLSACAASISVALAVARAAHSASNASRRRLYSADSSRRTASTSASSWACRPHELNHLQHMQQLLRCYWLDYAMHQSCLQEPSDHQRYLARWTQLLILIDHSLSCSRAHHGTSIMQHCNSTRRTSAASARAAWPSRVRRMCASSAALPRPRPPHSPPKLLADAGSDAAEAAAAAAAVTAAVADGLPRSMPARDAVAARRWLPLLLGTPASRASKVEM